MVAMRKAAISMKPSPSKVKWKAEEFRIEIDRQHTEKTDDTAHQFGRGHPVPGNQIMRQKTPKNETAPLSTDPFTPVVLASPT